MKTTPIFSSTIAAAKPQVSTYRGFIIVDRVTSADLVDPNTFDWMSCPSARSARWTAAVLDRVNSQLRSSHSFELECLRRGQAPVWYQTLFCLGQIQQTNGGSGDVNATTSH